MATADQELIAALEAQLAAIDRQIADTALMDARLKALDEQYAGLEEALKATTEEVVLAAPAFESMNFAALEAAKQIADIASTQVGPAPGAGVVPGLTPEQMVPPPGPPVQEAPVAPAPVSVEQSVAAAWAAPAAEWATAMGEAQQAALDLAQQLAATETAARAAAPLPQAEAGLPAPGLPVLGDEIVQAQVYHPPVPAVPSTERTPLPPGFTFDVNARKEQEKADKELGKAAGELAREQEKAARDLEKAFQTHMKGLEGGGQGGVGQTLGMLTGGIGLALGAFTAASGAVYGFVQAFSPATVMQFQQALSDLMAVVGVALTPVMEGLTTVAREVGAVLLPVMQSLQPVVQSLVQTALQALLPAIDTWASVLQSLVPVITFVAEVMTNLGTFVRVMATFVAGLVEQLRQWAAALFGWIGGLIGAENPAESFTTWLKTALQSVGEAAILAAGYLAKLVGATGFLEGMLKGLKGTIAERKDATGLAAPQQARVTGVMEFEKSALAAAFVATGGVAAPKDTNAWLEEVVKQLEAIQSGKDNKVSEFLEKLNNVEVLKSIKAALETIASAKGSVESAAGSALDAGKHAVGFLANPAAPIGAALAKKYPWLFGL